NSSIEQMQAYEKLISEVARTVDQFIADDTSCETHRAHLAERYPDIGTHLASAARFKLRTSRQQLLATMLLLGIKEVAPVV
ncbi:MAG: hypothetical protein ACXW3J_08410, partial [Methylocystis sp.]